MKISVLRFVEGDFRKCNDYIDDNPRPAGSAVFLCGTCCRCHDEHPRAADQQDLGLGYPAARETCLPGSSAHAASGNPDQ